jgi:hypothetical protein
MKGAEARAMANRDESIRKTLARFEAEFRAGKRDRSLKAINFCFHVSHPVPLWAMQQFCDALWNYEMAKARTLDEAFGVIRPKGWHRDAARDRLVRGIKAVHRLRWLMAKDGKTIEEAREMVCEELGTKDNPLSEATLDRWHRSEEIAVYLGAAPQKIKKSDLDK